MTKELLTRKESNRYPGLFVKKYTRKVFYDNLWHENKELMEARGHVELEDGTVVVRPFTKIFNRFENGTDINRDEIVLAVRKINGFMAAATYVPQLDKVIVSTTGSLDSDFVTLAEHYVNERVQEVIKRYAIIRSPTTFLFEIVDPSDPHIIPEEVGAYLIGYRAVFDARPYESFTSKEAVMDDLADDMGVLRPSWTIARFDEVVNWAKECKHEGYVVYGNRTVLKIKSPYYLTLKAAARRKDIMSLNKQNVDEEFYPLIDHLTLMGDSFTMMSEQERLDYMREFLK